MIWFVHASTGSDSNVGWRSDAPFLTLTKLETVMAPGDTAYLAGTFREATTFSSLQNCHWRQWPGQSTWVIRGDTVITGFSASGAGYTKTLAAGLSIKSVVVNWDTNINQYGLRYGHLTLAADAATALATTGTYFYNSGTGVLSLNTGANPATQTVAWCKNGNGFGLSSCSNCTVDDFSGYLWCDSAAGNGYAFIGTGCTGITVRVNVTRDCGYHHVGFPAGVCSYNVIEPSTGGLGRCEGSNTGGIPLVFYTDQANQTGNICRNMVVYASPLLKLNGSAVSTSWNVGGFITHTNGTATWAAGAIRLHRCDVIYPYANGNGAGGFSAEHTATPTPNTAAELVADNYGAIFTECRSWGTYNPGLVMAGSGAFVRCSFRDISESKCQTPSGAISHSLNATTATVLMDSCEIIADCDGASSANIFFTYTNRRLVLLNVSALDSGTGANERRGFFVQGNSATVRAHQCIFGSARATGNNYFFYANGGFNNDFNGAGLRPRVFEDCSYVRYTVNGMDTNGNQNTALEWTTNIDPGAQHTASNPCEEPATGQPMSNLRLSRSHDLWTYRDTGSSAYSASSIDGKRWTGTLGCYQYNSSATPNWPSLTSSPPPRVGKAMMMIGFYSGATTNDRMIRQDLYDDPKGFLEARFEKAGNAGVRTVLVHVPFGHNDTDYYPSGDVHEMPNHIRDTIVMCVDRWRDEYGINHFGPYLGAVWFTQSVSGPTKPLMFPDWEDQAVGNVLDSWREIGSDMCGLDAVVNRSDDVYSDPVDDQYDTLGGFTYHYSGMTPIGEAIAFDVDDFEATIAARSEFLIDQSYYNALSQDAKDILDNTLPAGRVGFHWLYFDSQFTELEAQGRVNQGYIVGAWDDIDQADMNWIGTQLAEDGTPGADGNNQSGTEVDPPVPTPPEYPVRNRARRMLLSVSS